MSWGGKVFKPSHSPLFKINDNYEGFLGEIISCRDHLQIPPECTTGCGVRWHPFPTSETANTIHFCPVLLTRKDLVLPKPEKRQNLLGAPPEGFSRRAVTPVPWFSTDPLGAGKSTVPPCATGSAVGLPSSSLRRNQCICSSWTHLSRQRKVLKEPGSRRNEVLSLWCQVGEGTRSGFLAQLLLQGLSVLRSCWIKAASSEFGQGLAARLPG